MTIDELIAATGLTANDEIPIWDAEATGEPTKKITAQQLATAIVALASLVTSVNGETGAVTLTAEDVNAKATQTAVADPTASGNAVAFIDSISQNAQGVILPTKKTVPNASTTAPGLMSAADKVMLANKADKADVDALDEEVDDIKNGVNENMTAGNAMQLDSSVYAEDQVPYLFRQTGGGVNAGTREIDTIVGGTVAWNQHLSDSATLGTNNVTLTKTDGVWHMIASAQSGYAVYDNLRFPLVGHRYLYSVQVKLTTGTTDVEISTWSSAGGSVTARTANTTLWQTVSLIRGSSGHASGNLVVVDNRSRGWDEIQFKNLQCFDLTQMFGTAIADRAYALEQATAGSGIAWLKSMGFFTQDYYPYDTGTLKSVEGLQSHDMTGFNKWDEKWELGSINSVGQKTDSSVQIRSKNYILVCPNTVYIQTAGAAPAYIVSYFYDAEYNHIPYTGAGAYNGGANPSNGVITTPSNARYMLFRCSTNYGTTYNHDICINISDPAKNRTYEPYDGHSYPIDSDLTLRGIPKLDANNKLYYDGDTYEADGSVTRRYGIVDLGTLTWNKYDDGVFRTLINGLKIYNTNEMPNVVTSIYQTSAAIPLSYVIDGRPDKSVLTRAEYEEVVVKDTAYTDAATFKAAMSGVYLVYELATPTAETADPFQTPQICDKAGTEEYVTTGIVPVGHLTKYPEDLRAKIEGLPWNLSMIAPIENGTTASQAYSAGQYFLHNDLFCKALTSIASGATFTLNTNYSVTTVAAELFAAINS